MKVMLINDNHVLQGGAEKYFFDLKTQLQQVPGVEVHSLGFGERAEFGDSYTILPQLQSNLGKLVRRHLDTPFIYRQLRNAIQQFSPDIIHLHNIKQYAASVLSAIHKFPVVQTMHDYSFICPTGQNIHRDWSICQSGFSWQCFWQHQTKFPKWAYLPLVLSFLMLRKKLGGYITHFLAPSPLLCEYLDKNKLTPVSYMPPFVPLPTTGSFDRLEPHTFLFAGQLAQHKGVELLIDEFALALKTKPHLILKIAGEGPLRDKLSQKVQALRLDQQIVFLGWQANLQCHYAESTAVIFPSLWMEAFGLVITEAMSIGRGVIVSDRGSGPWLVDHGISGLHFDPLQKGDLAKQILYLADNPGLSKQLGANALNKLKQFDNAKTTQSLLKVYNLTIQKHRQNQAST